MLMNASLNASNLSVPDVSVIIPTYNRISMLEEALASVLAQEFNGLIEIIVVDDNSQDNTAAVVSQKYPDVLLISLKQNVGASIARNRAIAAARGDYIAFLDSDDLWASNYLKTQMAALANQSDCFSITALVLLNTTTGKSQVRDQQPNLARFTSPIHQLLVSTSFILSPSTVVFCRKVFNQVGLFDETFRIGTDREFYLRCLLADYKLLFIEQPLVVVRKHDQGQLTDFDSETSELKKITRLAYLHKNFHLIEQRVPSISMNRIYAEIHATAAGEFYAQKDFLRWLAENIVLAKYSSVKIALLNLIRYIVRPAKAIFPLQALKMLKYFLLRDSLST